MGSDSCCSTTLFPQKLQESQDFYSKMNGGDSTIKLFGRKIPLKETQIPVGNARNKVINPETEVTSGEPEKGNTIGDEREKHQDADQVNELPVSSKSQEDHSENDSADQDKTFKKPDKLLPCPRCHSLDTKFCYFNNYNVNQPRHFCKNCQRYWTAGGTMRNVPIGAGRRKNKHLISQYRQIVVSSDGVPITQIETSDITNQQILSSGESAATTLRPSAANGNVLKFGTETPLCESMETVLSLGDQNRCSERGTANSGEIHEEPSSCGSSITVSSVQGKGLTENAVQNEQAGMAVSNGINTPHQLKCYPISPMVFPWSSGMNNIAAITASQGSQQDSAPNSSNANPVQWSQMVSVPGFCQPNIPLQFVPAYWGCMPLWAAAAGNVSVTGSNACSSPSSNSNGCATRNDSLTLGKHSRESNVAEGELSETCVVVPKTLRIDDPREASRSPIWSTLGLKPDQKVAVSGGSHILEANPAVLSLSCTFQEST